MRTDCVVAALLWDRVRRNAALRALRGQATVQFLASCRSLVGTLGRIDNLRAVLTTLWTPDGQSLVEELCELHADIPSLPIVAYIEFSPVDVRALVRAIPAGVSAVIIGGQDDSPAGLDRTILDAIGRSSTARLLQLVNGDLPASIRPLFRAIVNRTSGPLTVRELASACHVSRRTLLNQLHRASWPSPKRLISWARVLHASYLLDDLGRPIERVAHELEFSSASGLSNLLRRYIGLNASQLRQRGAFDCALTTFLQDCRPSTATVTTAQRRTHV